MNKIIGAALAAVTAAALTAASAYAAEWQTAVEETYEGGRSILNYTVYDDSDRATVDVTANGPNNDASGWDVPCVEYVGPNYGGSPSGGMRTNITKYIKSGDKLRISFRYRSSWFDINPFIEVLSPDGSAVTYDFSPAAEQDAWEDYQSGETEPVTFTPNDSVRLVLKNETGFWHMCALKIERYGDDGQGETPFLSDVSLTVDGAPAEALADGEIAVSGKVGGSADIYAALYKGGALTEVKRQSADSAFTVTMKNEGCDAMKIYAWDEMTPKAGPAEITAEGISQPAPLPAQPTAEPETIKDKYKNDFLIGSIYNPFNQSGADKDILIKHFNVITAENIMKPDYTQPSKGIFTLDNANAMMTFAQQNNLTVIGHALVWHSQTPAWFTQGSAAEVEENMKTHIDKMVGGYKGKIKGWDVVNEAILDKDREPNSWSDHLRKDGENGSPWFTAMGKDYIYKAYKFAHDADPDAELYYNDYNLDSPYKREAAARLVEHINDQYKAETNTDENLIDAIGMQSHYTIYTDTKNVRDSIDRFRKAGVRVNITELDVCAGDVPDNSSGNTAAVTFTPALEQRQAAKYAELMTIYRENADIIDRVTFWGYRDDTSWRRAAYPLMFNGDLTPKQAYDAIMDPEFYR